VLPAAYTSVIYSSNSPALFASGRFGIQSVALSAGAADAVQGQTVTTPATCRGSCVLVDAATISDPFYVRVRNDGQTTANVSLYVYGDQYGDDSEGINDSINTAPLLT